MVLSECGLRRDDDCVKVLQRIMYVTLIKKLTNLLFESMPPVPILFLPAGG